MSLAETLPYQQDRLAEALAEHEMALEEGQRVDRLELLARYADIAVELALLLDAMEQVDALARPLREALAGRAPLPFPKLEGYEILKEIGRGGMGVVYKARQKGTEQVVALKMLHPDWIARLDGDSQRCAIDQFLLEVKAAARLRHPNRVRILHLGEHQGQPFYAMELIEGCNLAEKAKQPGGVSKASAMTYLASVAEAVHEAHLHGALHRDLKPHNILIDKRSDQALLADFGLAKLRSSLPAEAPAGEESVRQDARLVGTLPYMSPEQTQNAENVTPASDVYSLGATLYELLTGAPRFPGAVAEGVLEKIRNEEPLSPRERGRDVSRGIEQICLKCLRKEPEQRYASALELAQALRRYLQEVRYSRHFTSMGALFMGLGPVVLLINLMVYLLVRINFYEPVIWLVMFSMYPALFTVFLLAPSTEVGQEHYLSRLELWSIWGGKLFTAATISIVLRIVIPQEAERAAPAILLVYPIFAALSGMATFALVSKMPRKLYGLAGGCWLAGISMAFHLEWAPIIYGAYCLVGLLLYGLYLRKVGKELR